LVVVLVPTVLPGQMVDVQDDIMGVDSSKNPGCANICLVWIWRIAALVIHLALVAIVVSVFVSETSPLHVLQPELHDGHGVELLAAPRVVPRISTAMRCVMGLTVLYFGVHLCISACRAASSERSRRRHQSTFDAMEHSLAFVPMLCVLMMSVRMRAVQLRLRDPQQWAQITMYFSTTAVTLQVLVAALRTCLSPSDEDEDDETGQVVKESSGADEPSQIRRKLALAVLLVVRYLFALCLYLAMMVLIAALFSMEEDHASAVDIRPDFAASVRG